jgi:hypothetical protein
MILQLNVWKVFGGVYGVAGDENLTEQRSPDSLLLFPLASHSCHYAVLQTDMKGPLHWYDLQSCGRRIHSN